MQPASLLEEIRFGYGPLQGATLAPGGVEPERVLAQLGARDPDGGRWDLPGLAQRHGLIEAYTAAKKAGTKLPADVAARLKQLAVADVQSFVGRPAQARAGFVERLVNLWANRITVSNASGGGLRLIQSFRDEAIRPNIATSYARMLEATLWHPAMQIYLTQTNSIGPNSPAGRRRGKGLNENLAREFLELHSMRSGYSQEDVTELARLLAGMKTDSEGRHVEANRTEPGVKRILGHSFRDDDPKTEIDRLVALVARRPETAQNVAFTLARHFIADVPPVDLVTDLARAYLEHDTELPPLYALLLRHPAANAPERQKLRSPQEFVAASLRLMGVTGPGAAEGWPKLLRRIPLALADMGQPPLRAPRPDGWPEVAEGWLTPPMVAARMDWSVDLAHRFGARTDPSDMVDAALGELASPLLRQAAGAAEQRWEGVAVLLASPEFSRR
jgi:uncharacterized protein (DUF1800 family)